MFNKVLVPLDGSELAEGILPYVSLLARGLDMPILLLTVVDPDSIEIPEALLARRGETSIEVIPGFPGGAAGAAPRREPETQRRETGGPYISQQREAVEARTKSHLVEVAGRLKKEGAQAETLVKFGKPAEVIVEAAEERGCDLIAMSTHGRNPLGRAVLGSVTDKVIHSAKTPVLTITPERAEKYRKDGSIKRIMVPLDGSPLAETVLPYVEDIATKMSLEVVLVRVIKTAALYAPYADAYAYPGYAELEKEVEEEARDYLGSVARRLRSKGLKVDWKVLRGSPAASIVELARETPQDLIALTTRGRSGITRWVLGSVAEALVRSSGDPVLVVPPQEEE